MKFKFARWQKENNQFVSSIISLQAIFVLLFSMMAPNITIK